MIINMEDPQPSTYYVAELWQGRGLTFGEPTRVMYLTHRIIARTTKSVTFVDHVLSDGSDSGASMGRRVAIGSDYFKMLFNRAATSKREALELLVEWRKNRIDWCAKELIEAREKLDIVQNALRQHDHDRVGVTA